jgi:hypothetical protein
MSAEFFDFFRQWRLLPEVCTAGVSIEQVLNFAVA